MNWLGEMPLGIAYRSPSARSARRTAALEHGVVHDLVQQDGEVEDREALDQGERDPDQRMLEMDETPGRQPEDRELPHRHDPVAPGVLAMQLAQLLPWQGFAQLGLEGHRVL